MNVNIDYILKTGEKEAYFILNSLQYFDSMADKWDDEVCHDIGKIKYLIDKLSVYKGATLLDVGSGTGILIPFLSEFVGNEGKIVANDISEKMLNVARSKFKYGNVTYLSGDALKINPADHQFDFIICYSMFPHFEDKKKAVIKLAGLLKEKGKLMICHSQSRKEINHVHKLRPAAIKKHKLPEMNKLKRLLIQTGLSVVSETDSQDIFFVIASKEVKGANAI